MKNWSLSRKVGSVMGLLVLAFIGSTYFALSRMTTIRDSLNEVTTVFVKRNQLTAQIRDNQRMLTIDSREILLQNNEEKIHAIKKNFDDTLAKQKSDVQSYEKVASLEGQTLIQKYASGLDQWVTEVRRSQKLASEKNNKEAIEALFSASSILQTMRGDLQDVEELTTRKLAEKSEESNTLASHAIQLCLILSAVSIVLSCAIGFVIMRAVTQSIHEIVKNLFESSAQVSSAAAQIASASEELSQSASEQAASLEETAASIEEMNSMVAKNSENATATSKTSGLSQEKATHGKVVVEKMIHSMSEINQSNGNIMEQVNRSNENMVGVVKVIEEIENKTKVINEIVFQTKLLSFNASVEAARAGEHGKGFAVVAEEVGNLAQMSGNAAKEISGLLGSSVQKVKQIVEETKSSVEKLIAEGKQTVESGTKVAHQCGEVLEEIVQNVSNVSAMASEIASASQEQARGVSEITKAMSQLDQTTQQNAATSEECASSAEELSAQSETLKNAVSQLVSTIQGSDGTATAEKATSYQPSTRGGKVLALKTSKNVVHLKSAKEKMAGQGASLKVAGGVPSYNSDGFEDI